MAQRADLRGCTLYVNQANERRCLVVAEGAPFPARFRKREWRLVAYGMPIGADAAWSLEQSRFYQYLAPLA